MTVSQITDLINENYNIELLPDKVQSYEKDNLLKIFH